MALELLLEINVNKIVEVVIFVPCLGALRHFVKNCSIVAFDFGLKDSTTSNGEIPAKFL